MENNRTENTNRKKIAVLFGGCSTEYQVSLQSAHAVISNIDTDCYELFMIGIAAANGQWYLYRGNIDDIPEDRWLSECRATFYGFQKIHNRNKLFSLNANY